MGLEQCTSSLALGKDSRIQAPTQGRLDGMLSWSYAGAGSQCSGTKTAKA